MWRRGILEQCFPAPEKDGAFSQCFPTLLSLPLFRACRLKKKAQHEANKIKLWGLNQEYGQYGAGDAPHHDISVGVGNRCNSCFGGFHILTAIEGLYGLLWLEKILQRLGLITKNPSEKPKNAW